MGQNKFNVWIHLFFLLGLQYTQAAWLRCYDGDMDHYIQAPLEMPTVILNSTCFDWSLPTIVYTFGYRGRANGNATTAVITAYLATKKRNVILLDWEEEARSGLLGIPLGYALSAVPNANQVGRRLGEALAVMARYGGMNMTRVHLVGHSLGAHLMGFAGRTAREMGYTVSRITGLDPARALFEGTLSLQQPLDRRCASFVDIIHTDPGNYGTSQPSGTVDMWPNYVSSGATQPGCPEGHFEMFTPEDLCSHDRSWSYFVESIRYPATFPAKQALNFDDWVARAILDTNTAYMGDLTNMLASGNFFLTTNPRYPFAQGIHGMEPDMNRVRRKRHHSPLMNLLKFFR